MSSTNAGGEPIQPLERWEDLVDQLLKESPEEILIQQLMEDLGLEYSQDPIQRMGLVLKAFDV